MRAGFGLQADLPAGAFPGQARRRAAADLAAADPHEIVEVTRVHRMMQALTPGFEAAPELAAAVDPDLVVFFAEMRAAARRRNAALTETLAYVGRLLAEAGLDAVVLKGGAELLQPFDGATGRDGRFMGDLDLLLAPEAAEAAQARLIAAGWAPEETPEVNLGRHHHLPALGRPDLPGQVELHRQLGGAETEAALPAASLIARSVPSGLPGIRLPAPGDRALHLILHAQFGEGAWAERRVRICDVMDLGRVARGQGAALLEGAVAAAAAAGQGAPAAGLMAATHRLLPEIVPEMASAPSGAPGAARWGRVAVARIGRPGAQRRAYLVRRLRERLAALFTDPGRRAHWWHELTRKGGFRTALRTMRDDLDKRI